MIKLWLPLFVCLTSTGYVLSMDEDENCKTPYDEEGICIYLNECDVQMGSYAHHMRINSYVSQLICGVKDKDILVCCPKKRMLKFLPNRPECGNSSSSVRIVGGTSVEEGKYPWMVVLGFSYQGEGTDTKEFVWTCGGALITKRFVLSAAHCFSNSDTLVTTARLGVVNIEPDEGTEAKPVDISIEKVIINENYILGEVAHDIAVIKLAQDVEYSMVIQPICLPMTAETMSPEFEKRELFIAGWGADEYNGAESSKLQEVQIPIFDNLACKTIFEKKANITEDQICAGSLLGGKGTCQGDSGGPLMTYDYRDGGFYAIGISSFGYKCATRGYPGVYTRISSYTKWIKGAIINNLS